MTGKLAPLPEITQEDWDVTPPAVRAVVVALCWAHLQRNLRAIEERHGKDVPWPKARALSEDLMPLWDGLWVFVTVEGVEPTNNAAEQALRPAVLWRKGSFGTQSEAGSRFVERILTVWETCRRQGRSLRAGRPAPKLVPTP